MRSIASSFIVVLLAIGAVSCSNTAPASTSTTKLTTQVDAATTSGGSSNNSTGGVSWTRFRGPNATGISPETGINKQWKQSPPVVIWKQTLTDNGYAGPSVANGNVYIVDHNSGNDIVRAIDINTGKEKWRYAYPDATGENYGYARATPAIDNGKVYTYSRLGKLTCLDAAEGKLIWQKDIVNDFHGNRPNWEMSCSPLIDGDKVIVYAGGPNSAIVALNKDDGSTIWAGGGSYKPGYSTPVKANIEGKDQYVCFVDKGVIGVDAATGKQLWGFPWQTSYDVNAATPLVIGNSVFITSGYNTGCAMIDIKGMKASLRWKNAEMQAHFSSPVYVNNYIYGTGDPGQLMCLDPKSGRALWKQEGFEKGGIAVVDGTIIGFNGAGGDLIMASLSSSGYKELGRFNPLGGQSWTAPIVSNGKLIVRNTNTLACISLK